MTINLGFQDGLIYVFFFFTLMRVLSEVAGAGSIVTSRWPRNASRRTCLLRIFSAKKQGTYSIVIVCWRHLWLFCILFLMIFADMWWQRKALKSSTKACFLTPVSGEKKRTVF